MSIRPTLKCSIVALSVFLPASLGHAQGEDYGTPNNDRTMTTGLWPSSNPIGALCSDPEAYATGVLLRLTDRVISLGLICRRATWDGIWQPDSISYERVAGSIYGQNRLVECPTNRFMSGVGLRTGSYSADTYGLAKPDIGRLIADIRPVCELRNRDPRMRPPNPLTQAGDNDVRIIPWVNNGPRDCPQGLASYGASVNYQAGRNLDPNYRFYAIALYCKRLRTGVPPGAASVKKTP